MNFTEKEVIQALAEVCEFSVKIYREEGCGVSRTPYEHVCDCAETILEARDPEDAAYGRLREHCVELYMAAKGLIFAVGKKPEAGAIRSASEERAVKAIRLAVSKIEK